MKTHKRNAAPWWSGKNSENNSYVYSCLANNTRAHKVDNARQIMNRSVNIYNEEHNVQYPTHISICTSVINSNECTAE